MSKISTMAYRIYRLPASAVPKRLEVSKCDVLDAGIKHVGVVVDGVLGIFDVRWLLDFTDHALIPRMFYKQTR